MFRFFLAFLAAFFVGVAGHRRGKGTHGGFAMGGTLGLRRPRGAGDGSSLGSRALVEAAKTGEIGGFLNREAAGSEKGHFAGLFDGIAAET